MPEAGGRNEDPVQDGKLEAPRERVKSETPG